MIKIKMSNSKIFGKKIVAYLYLLFVATSILGDILYWTVSKYFAGYAKLYFYSALLVVMVDALIKKKIIYDRFIISMLLCGGVGMILGVLNNALGKEYLAHFSPFMLAIMAYSYGYRSEINGEGMTETIDKYIIHAGVALICLIFIYYAMVKFGYINYFGAGALLAYPVFYCLSKGYYYYAGIFYSANILTGKRSVLIAITIVVLIYVWKRSNSIVRWILISFMPLVVFVVVKNLEVDEGLIFGGQMDRYFNILIYLKENDNILEAIDLATSGRIYDGLAVINRLGNDIASWVFGLGFGAKFEVEYSFSQDVHETHYSHVTPLSYLLVGGGVLLYVVYGKILKEIFRALKNYDDHLAMLIIYFFIIGFSGAIFFTDTFVWIFLGIFSARKYAADKMKHKIKGMM